MKMRYIHEDGAGRIQLWTESDAEARMLAALEPMDHSLQVRVTVERSGTYGGAPIKSLQLDLRPVKGGDPEPLG